jgi:dipeptidyl aminopeptidase/acylaminoacyl peptidase
MRAMIAVMFGLVLAGSALAQAPAPLPAAAFGRLPAVSDVAISPDGTKLVTLGAVSGMRVATLLDISGEGNSKLITQLSPPEGNTLRSVAFVENDFAAYVISRTLTTEQATQSGWVRAGPRRLYEYARAFVTQVSSGESRQMMTQAEGTWVRTSLADLHAPVEGDPGFGHMIATTGPEQTAPIGVSRVNLRTGRATVAEKIGVNVYDALLNSRGEAVVRTMTEPATNTWRLGVKEGSGRWRDLTSACSRTGAPPDLLGLFPDGRIGIFSAQGEKGLGALIAVNPQTGAEETIFAVEGHDLAGVVRDPWSGLIVGARWTDDVFPKQRFFDADLEAIRLKVEARFQSGYALLVSWSQDRSRIVLQGEGAGAPTGGYFLYTPKTDGLLRVGAAYPDVGVVGQVQSIRFAARDKARVPAVVYLPLNAPEGPKPMVALVHGGPAARDDATFDYWAGFLASRG